MVRGTNGQRRWTNECVFYADYSTVHAGLLKVFINTITSLCKAVDNPHHPAVLLAILARKTMGNVDNVL